MKTKEERIREIFDKLQEDDNLTEYTSNDDRDSEFYIENLEWTDFLDILESYATQEREKAEADKKELAKEMNRQFSIEFERLEAEKKAFAREMVIKYFNQYAMVFAKKAIYSSDLDNWLTANNLNEPKPE